MILLFILTFLDLVGFGIIMPMLTVFIHNYNLSSLQIGFLVSSFFFGQFFGSIFIGYLSDVWGKKQVLILSLLFLTIAYFLNGFIQLVSKQIFLLILMRFIIGYFSGYISIIFATVCSISSKKNLVKNMSYLGSAFSLGFIFGPIIGGYLSRNYDSITPYYYTSMFYAICLTLVIIFYKEPKIQEDNSKIQNILAALKDLLVKPKILINLGTFIFFSFSLSGIEVFLLTQTLGLKMGFSPLNIALIWTYFAITLTIVQIFITKYIPKNYSIIGGLILFGISTISLSFFSSLYMLCIILAIIAFSLGILFPNINAELSLQGNNKQKGLIFGINFAAESIGGFLGPYILGYIYSFNGLLYIIWLTIGILAFIVSAMNIYDLQQKILLNIDITLNV